MKLLHNKFTEVVILLPIVAFFIIAGYYFYNTYTIFSNSEKSLNYSEYNYKLNSVLKAIGEEQESVSIYLGTSGKSDFKELEKQWEKTDATIVSLKEFTQNNTLYASRGTKLIVALKKLEEMRSKVSLLTVSYIDPTFGEYGQKIKETILSDMHSMQMTGYSSDKELERLLNVYTNLGSVVENASSEQALVSFFISREKFITIKELEHWDSKIGKNRAPDYSSLTQSKIIKALDALLKADNFKDVEQKIFSARIAVLAGSQNGSFDTGVTEWYKIQSEKITLLDQAQSTIFNLLKENVSFQMNNSKETMSISAVIMIIALLLGLIVRGIFSGMSRDAKNLENILKNIDIDADMEREYHLKEMLVKQDKAEIYKFLERIIHESKESKHLAEKANETKSLFLANMSHEIRTPLNGIVGFTDLLKASDLNSEQSEFVQIIEKSSENLLAVINDILDLSKIESDKIDIEEIEFDPIIEFESGIESYGAKASEKNIDLGFFIDPALSNQLKGDPNKIKQVIVNLISNAVKFTPNDGNIDILIKKLDSSDDETTIQFSVKDSGIGITPEQKTKIFEAFSQADISTNRKFGGTGLGLTISRRLVELMGGKLDLESEKDIGTTFFFTLKFQEMPSVTESIKFDDISIGFYLPLNDKIKQSDRYVKKYITALNKNYELYDTIESLQILKENEQPDLLFVDYDHLSGEDFKYINGLRSKVSLLTSVNRKNEIKMLDHNLFKVLYAPINFTKIKKSILDLNSNDIELVKEAKGSKFTKIKALVAEDNPINQKLIKRVLENIGITVTLADHGKEAFKLRRAETFDVIFMDIQMPVMNGLEATRAIINYEKEKKVDHIPIIALTANALKGDAERFMAEGMDDYLSKPININLLENTLHKYFPDKYIENDIILDKSPLVDYSESDEKSIDILLCKEKKEDIKIFGTLLRKIGYSVDVAVNIEELKEMMKTNRYKYVLLDKHTKGLSEDDTVSDMLKELSIQSILFVENLNMVAKSDYGKYTRVVLNVSHIEFLRNIIMQLSTKEYEEYKVR